MSWYDQQMTATMGGSGAVSRPSMAGGSFVAEHGGQGTQPGNRGQGYSGGMGMTFVQWVRTLTPAQRLHYQRTGGLTGKRFVNLAPSLGITPIQTGTGDFGAAQFLADFANWAAPTVFGLGVGQALGLAFGYGPGMGFTGTVEASIKLGLVSLGTGYYAEEYSPEGSAEQTLLSSISFTTGFMALLNLGNIGPGDIGGAAIEAGKGILNYPVIGSMDSNALIKVGVNTSWWEELTGRPFFSDPSTDWEWFIDIYN